MAILLQSTSFEKQPRVTTVANPQTISFRKIKRKRGAKKSAQTQIKRFYPPVDEVVTENEKKNPAKMSLKDVIQKDKTGKRNQRK